MRGYALYQDRREAGRQLAPHLAHLKDARPIVLALPRGGVPVGFEVAQALGAPLDVLLVRKIGVPWQPELALGAVVGGETPAMVINDEVARLVQPSPEYLEQERARQLAEIDRRRTLYVGDRAPPSIENRTVIVVDDGIATGATVRAAIQGLRQAGPARLVLAVPVAPTDTLARLRTEVDEVVCPATPAEFGAVGMFYANFDQTSDEEVIDLLAQAVARQGS